MILVRPLASVIVTSFCRCGSLSNSLKPTSQTEMRGTHRDVLIVPQSRDHRMEASLNAQLVLVRKDGLVETRLCCGESEREEAVCRSERCREPNPLQESMRRTKSREMGRHGAKCVVALRDFLEEREERLLSLSLQHLPMLLLFSHTKLGGGIRSD